MAHAFDRFNRGNSAVALGTSETGQAWIAPATSGGFGTNFWGITGGVAYVSQSNPNRAAYLDSGLADCIVGVTLSGLAANVGLSLRAQDDSNYLTAVLQATNVQLYTFVATVYSSKGISTQAFAEGSRLAVKMVGSTIDLYVNRVHVLGPITLANFSTQTKHGLRAYGSTAGRFDDFGVTDLALGNATAWTFTGPSSAFTAVPTTYTVRPTTGGMDQTVTFSDGGAGGTFSPTALYFASEATPQDVRYTPAAAGSVTLSASASPGGLAAPAGLSVTVTDPPLIEIGTPVTLGGREPNLTSYILPGYAPWKSDKSGLAVHPDSAAMLAKCIGNLNVVYDPVWFGFKINIVPHDQALITYAWSNPTQQATFSPYQTVSQIPMPASPGIEGVTVGNPLPTSRGTDQHLFILVASPDQNSLEGWYEGYNCAWLDASDVNSVAVDGGFIYYPANGNYDTRQDGFYAMDAVGSPMVPSVLGMTYEAFQRAFTSAGRAGVLPYAPRFTMSGNMSSEHWPPARAQATNFPNSRATPQYQNAPGWDLAALPAGAFFRMKSDAALIAAGVTLSDLNDYNRVLINTLQTKGMYFADNGPNLQITGVTDNRWPGSTFAQLTRFGPAHFEVVVPPVGDASGDGCSISPSSSSGAAGVSSSPLTISLLAPTTGVRSPLDFKPIVLKLLRAWLVDGSGAAILDGSGHAQFATFTMTPSSGALNIDSATPSATFTLRPAAGTPVGTYKVRLYDDGPQRAIRREFVYAVTGAAPSARTPYFHRLLPGVA